MKKYDERNFRNKSVSSHSFRPGAIRGNTHYPSLKLFRHCSLLYGWSSVKSDGRSFCLFHSDKAMAKSKFSPADDNQQLLPALPLTIYYSDVSLPYNFALSSSYIKYTLIITGPQENSVQEEVNMYCMQFILGYQMCIMTI